MSEYDDDDGFENVDEGVEEPVEVPEPADSGTPATFDAAGSAVAALDDPTPHGRENALQKLGRPPFDKSARSKFRLLGFLATVYEHVSQDVAAGGKAAI